MTLFATLKADGLEEAQDRLGGSKTYETDIYVFTVKAAYASPAASGAMGVGLVLDLDGDEYKETVYVTNKKGENYFEKNGKKVPLPGFTLIDDICLIVTGKPLASAVTAEKVLNVYNPDQKKEVPTSVQVLTELTGEKIALSILKQKVNKQVKTNDGYVPTNESREENAIDKAFHPTQKLTVVEAKKGEQEAKFWDAWLEQNKGKTRDRFKEVKAPNGAPAAAGGAAPARTSMFGPKA